MQRFLYWLSGWLKVRPIPPTGEVYLERYFLFQIPWLGITAYLHRFLLSDPGRELHNHPWPWALALLLSGLYEEERVANFVVERRILKAPCLNRFTANTIHRINMIPGTETWSLFIHGPWSQVWGFAHFKHIINRNGDMRDGLIDDKYFDSLGIEPYPPAVFNQKQYGRHGDQWWKNAPRARDLRLP